MVVVMSTLIVVVEPRLLTPTMLGRNGADETLVGGIVTLVTDIWRIVDEVDEDKNCPGEGAVESLELGDTKLCNLADLDEELVNPEAELFEDGCGVTLLESDKLVADLNDEPVISESESLEDGCEVTLLERDKMRGDVDNKAANSNAVPFEDDCEVTTLESDKLSVDIAWVDEAPVMFDVIDAAVTLLHKLFPVDDALENAYDVDVNDDGAQFLILLEEVGLEPLEVPLEAESPGAQGIVEDTLKLVVEPEAISWRASRLIFRPRVENKFRQR